MVRETVINNADSVLQENEAQAKSQFLPIIGPDKGEYLVDAIREIKPKRVLEVGTLVGYSAIVMGKEMQVDSEIVTIEIHRNEANQAEQNISKANIPAKVKIIAGNALDVIPTLQGTFDFVFIDAEKTEYLFYLKAIEPKLHMVQWYLLITQAYLLHR